VSDRTWDDNREAINQLWPVCDFRPEEAKAWHDDLSVLDQESLYGAIREVYRSHDSSWPKLAWIHAAYRSIAATKHRTVEGAALRRPAWSGSRLAIDQEQSSILRAGFTAEIESASRDAIPQIQAMVEDAIGAMGSTDALALLRLLSAKRDPSPSQCDGPSPEDIQQREEAAALLRNHAERIREKQEAST